MSKMNASGFYCFIDDEILSQWKPLMKEVKLSRSQAIEYMMAEQLDSFTEKKLLRFRKEVKEYFLEKKDE